MCRFFYIFHHFEQQECDYIRINVRAESRSNEQDIQLVNRFSEK